MTTTPTRSIAPTSMIAAATDGRVVGFGNTDLAGFFGYGIRRKTDVPIASVECEGSVNG